MKETLQERINGLRAAIKQTGEGVFALPSREDFKVEPRPSGILLPRSDGEMRANVMLAYRHLEDARMRLGKVLQAMDGGVSCYDK